MSRDSRLLVTLTTVCVAAACATHTAPDGYLPSIEEAQREAYGGWVDVTFRNVGGLDRVAGELIAVTADSLWVRDASGGTVVPTALVEDGRLTSYDSEADKTGVATVLGFLSTVSNGVFLLFTGPMWLIGGGVAAHSQSRVPMDDVPPMEWSDLAAFARFPQGMPPGVELRALQPMPRR